MSRGFAWAGRDYGPACMSVTGIDAVTAEGERVHADESRNTDLLWAARGAGPGFFAVVTRFHVKLYPRKRITMNSGYFWPASAARDVYGFVHEIGRQTPAEINLMCNRDPLTNDEPLISLNATAFTGTEEEAREQLSVFEHLPARAQLPRTRTRWGPCLREPLTEAKPQSRVPSISSSGPAASGSCGSSSRRRPGRTR
ncbi:hypothetical protein [Streptomyces sp. NPDC007883]|uniref:hypothetical protein n=1 Tax=Streptomyces sp. NPDC007883 TaxID=3155116 RepID=UPI0034087B63